jgi:hypothetical protein
LNITNHGGRFGENRHLLLEERRAFHQIVGRHGADNDGAILLPDARQSRDLADVDQRFRLRQAEIHDGEQAMAAGKNLRLPTVLREE